MEATADNEARKPQGQTDDPLVWIDCEMTGLDPDVEEIIEIYCIVTTGNLEVLDEAGFHAVVHQPAERMAQMDAWCTKTHADSGLTAAVAASTTTPQQAADALYAYITGLIPERKRGLLAGNSVHCDRLFLRRAPYAPVVRHLHHRILDVSTIKEAARRWCPRRIVNRVPTKKGRHKARDDILESIDEARYYRDAIFGLAFDQPEPPRQPKPPKPPKQPKNKDKSEDKSEDKNEDKNEEKDKDKNKDADKPSDAST